MPALKPQKLLSWNAEGNIEEKTILSLVKDGEISISRGAELLGMSVYDFEELMGKYDIPIWDNDEEEEDRAGLKNLQKLLQKEKV